MSNLDTVAPLEGFIFPNDLHPNYFSELYSFATTCLEHSAFLDLIQRLINKPQHSTIGAAERAFLYMLVRQIQARNILEIGTYFAGTTQLLALAAVEVGDCKVYTIDPQGAERAPALLREWPACLAETVVFRPFYSTQFLGPLSNIPNFDLIFIDGNHRYPNVLHDLYASDENLLPGGFMIADNAEQPDVMDATRLFVSTNYGYDAVVVSNWRATSDQPARIEVSRSLQNNGAVSSFAILRKPTRVALNDRSLPYRLVHFPELKAPPITVSGSTKNGGALNVNVTISYLPFQQVDAPEGFSKSALRCFDFGRGQFHHQFNSELSLPDTAANGVRNAEISLSGQPSDGSVKDLRVWWGGLELLPHRNFYGRD